MPAVTPAGPRGPGGPCGPGAPWAPCGPCGPCGSCAFQGDGASYEHDKGEKIGAIHARAPSLLRLRGPGLHPPVVRFQIVDRLEAVLTQGLDGDP